jgi:hypothetical protein
MRYSARVRGPVAFLSALSLFALVGWQATEPVLDDAGLKTMLAGLGHEVKETAPGIYDISITAAGLKIPTRAFLSKSKTKLWLSVALLKKEGVDKLTQDDLRKVLEKNVDVGPCHFMIEGGMLKMKMALDNRGLTPVLLRSEIDYLAARVGDSKATWQRS